MKNAVQISQSQRKKAEGHQVFTMTYAYNNYEFLYTREHKYENDYDRQIQDI